jgi:hypothetical protein
VVTRDYSEIGSKHYKADLEGELPGRSAPISPVGTLCCNMRPLETEPRDEFQRIDDD